ncbi:putative calcium/calmodulin-dependent protein kinase [Rosa chinensis]|uniref:Putative calcium/calmodulin-dependent protein kinase n=1 Tax=Rosa chinensis TaxID=74649 RepID=A0A2P6S8G8_ROSCH|nr:calmodulin binding protein PICBP [Rosa chinensis]PRQ54993.1 putative calcium/calmodulin-dependent protein kinase [Rosa chinensis]
MVQRKVQNQLAKQADPNVKFEKRLVNLKPSSQFQDGKNRGGADLKIKMKKSRSTKLSDIESLRSPSSSSSLPLRKSTSQPGKPPPLNVQSIAAAAAVPLKQALTKTSDGSAPNYMKSTSCSDARKEQSQVSVRSSPVISDSKNQNRRSLSNSKLSSGSNTKSARTSSLKLVRTLIKSPSFKHARASAKKTSRVALCEDVRVQKATCSSTLKDSKFPKYLMISPGGTEAEGTSMMKVCPYTYCSLNGHHHSPVTPLKCFLSARRRSLKNQKMVKLQALSPRKAKPSNLGMKETDSKQMLYDDNEKPAQEEVGIDFFVEIFAKSKEDDAQTNFENIPEAETIDSFPEEKQKEDVADEEYQHSLDQEEPAMRSCSSESDTDGLSSVEVDYANSEATDMEWEEGQFSLAVLYDDDESGSSGGFSSIQDGDMHEEPVIKSDAIVINCNDIIHDYYEVLQELFTEKTPSFETQLKNDGSKQNFGIEESERLSYDQFSYTEDSFEEDSELSETEIEISSSSIQEPTEDLTATGEEVQEKTGMESHLGDVESHYTAACETDEASDSQPRNEFQDDGTTMSTSNRISNAAQDISTTYEAETNAEKEKSETDQNAVTSVSGNQMEEAQKVEDTESSADIQISDSAKTMVVHDEDASKVGDNADTAGDCNSGQGIADENTFVESKDNLANREYTDNAKAENNSYTEKDQSEFKKEKISSSSEGEDQSDLKLKQIGVAENSGGDIDGMEVDNNSGPDAAETFRKANSSISPGMKRKFSHQESNSEEELLNTKRKWKINCKRTIKDEEEQWKYNQRKPNYLPLVPGPEAEKVDLRHQTMDEKKNAEEWMLDFAIQQAVTKLAPARKKKVALLVEAFEKVMPVPQYEPRLKHSSAAFSHARPMQACS